MIPQRHPADFIRLDQFGRHTEHTGDFIYPMCLYDMRVLSESNPCRCLFPEFAGLRGTALESLKNDLISGRMLDNIDNAKPTLKNMENSVSAGNRISGSVSPRT